MASQRGPSRGRALRARIEHNRYRCAVLTFSGAGGAMPHKPTYKQLEERIAALEQQLAGAVKGMPRAQDDDEMYRSLFEHARDAIYISTRDGAFVDANPAFLELLGYSRRELLNDINVRKLYERPEERKVFQREIERSGFVKNYELKMRTRDGTALDCLLSGSVRKTAGGKIAGYQGVIRDITAEKQAQRDLRESEERYRMLFEDSPISLWEFDFSGVRNYIDRLRGRAVRKVRSYFQQNPEDFARCARLVKITNVNRATLELFQAGSFSALRKGIDGIFISDSFEVFREALIALAEDKRRAETEVIMQTLAGDKRQLVLRWFVVSGHQQSLKRVLASFIDVTDLKTMERERANLTSMLAHDIKSGFMVIQGFAMRLLNKSLSIDEENTDKYHEVIKREASKLELLVDDFLEFSRLKSGKLTLSFAPTLIDRELLELYESYQPRAAQQGIRLEIACMDPSPIIMADAGRLRRVFTNLLDNALKFSANGGCIAIQMEDMQSSVSVAIRDEGMGITPEEIELIFDPFHRGKDSTCKEGYGMGLAAVKAIVEGHGGTVRAASRPGSGSTFTVVLPKQHPSAGLQQ